MRFRRMIIKAAIVLGVLAALSITLALWYGSPPQGKGSSGMDILLTRPAFAQDMEASFLDEEAGIAAYTNMGGTLDLEKVRSAFKTIEKETDTYIVGSISIPDYEDYRKEDAHTFVHKDGWIVVYYLKAEPVTKIMNWQKWSSDKLEIGLIKVLGALAVAAPPYVKYYHYKYPDATKIMIVAKGETNGSFRLMIPGSFTVYERSWSNCRNSDYYGDGSLFSVDGESVSDKERQDGEYGVHGFLAAAQLTLDVYHTIEPKNGYYVGIALVSREY